MNRTTSRPVCHRPGSRGLRELDRAEALRLLGSVQLGRIVFTQHALPMVRPVNHLMDGDAIVVRVHGDGALSSLMTPSDPQGVVVAYEADVIDPRTRLGWSVVATGYALPVADPETAARYARTLTPWVADETHGTLRIQPDLITGFRLVPRNPTTGPPPRPGH
ncbi:pyridoxamine 5'-phosphate oxidase family protein [Streptomyces sp. NPDC086023]|uniref:pyridoxamine 5'-phosphate oxidase family protein n=1 Tax=Streptomyces sp. NPDC086023 TaxID=3365746 RepID=UPI0037D0675D